MKTTRVFAVVAALFVPGLASAGDLLSKEKFIDYQAQMRCAEFLYSHTDAARYEQEQTNIDKAFKVKEKDLEAGRIDELMTKYDTDNSVVDAIAAKVQALCPQRE